MMKFPDYQAFRERARQAMLKGDAVAMDRAFEDYAKEVARSGQVLEENKPRMIREAKEHLYGMFKALDAERDKDSST